MLQLIQDLFVAVSALFLIEPYNYFVAMALIVGVIVIIKSLFRR